jgi:hypothetical protein
VPTELLCYVAVALFVIFLCASWYAIWRLLQLVMVPRVFISYRRKDRADIAAQVYQSLKDEYRANNVYFDVTMDEGQTYTDMLSGWLGSSETIITIVGPHWDGRLTDTDRPRVFRPEDWIFHEGKYAVETLKNYIVVHVPGPTDDVYRGVPKYTEEQLEDWCVTPLERGDFAWMEELRTQTALRISLDNKGELVGIDKLKSRIAARRQGAGRRWLTAWKWGAGALVVTVGVLSILIATWVADIRPLEKRTVDAIKKLDERTTENVETLKKLDGVVINTLPIEDFVQQYFRDVNTPNQDRFEFQYVCWKLKLKECERESGGNSYRITLVPDMKLPSGGSFRVVAFLDVREYDSQLKAKWNDGKGAGLSVVISGRISVVNQSGVVLYDCRVVAQRSTSLSQ